MAMFLDFFERSSTFLGLIVSVERTYNAKHYGSISLVGIVFTSSLLSYWPKDGWRVDSMVADFLLCLFKVRKILDAALMLMKGLTLCEAMVWRV